MAVSIYVGLFLGLPLVLLSGVEFLAGFYLAGGLLLLYFLGTRAENLFIRAHASRAFNVSLSTVLGLLGLLLVGGVIFAALMFVASRQGSSGLSELVRWAAMASLALPVGAYLYVLVQSIVGIVKACKGQTVQTRAVVEVLKARA